MWRLGFNDCRLGTQWADDLASGTITSSLCSCAFLYQGQNSNSDHGSWLWLKREDCEIPDHPHYNLDTQHLLILSIKINRGDLWRSELLSHSQGTNYSCLGKVSDDLRNKWPDEVRKKKPCEVLLQYRLQQESRNDEQMVSLMDVDKTRLWWCKFLLCCTVIFIYIVICSHYWK